MRISRVTPPAIGRAARRLGTDLDEQTEAECETHALIAIDATAASERPLIRTRHPAAPFLAHLIATRMQEPQTRARRRADPEDAVAVYQRRAIRPPHAIGGVLRRSA
jgi:hypothetical protein